MFLMAPRRSTRTPRPSAKSAAALPKTVPPTTAAKPPAATTRTRRPAVLRRQPTIRPASSKAPPSVDMKTAAGSGHKRGDLPPPGPVLHKLGPDFQLLAVEDHVGLITQGKPEVGVIKEVHFFEQSGGRTKIPTSETGTVHYYVHVLNGHNILANSKTVYKLPADKRGAEDLVRAHSRPWRNTCSRTSWRPPQTTRRSRPATNTTCHRQSVSGLPTQLASKPVSFRAPRSSRVDHCSERPLSRDR